MKFIKDWQMLIGLLAIAIAILVGGFLIAQEIQRAGSNLFQGVVSLGELIRTGLSQ